MIAFTGYAHPFGEVSYYGAERLIWYLMQELEKQGQECVLFSVKGCKVPGIDFVEMPKPWDDSKDIYLEAIEAKEAKEGAKFDMIHSFMASGYIDNRLRERQYCLYPFMGFRNFQDNIIAYSKRINEVHGNTGTVIYPGIPSDLYEMGEDKNYVVWVGRIDAGKSPDIAIEAAKRAGIRIVLMGPSYHYPFFVDNIWKSIDGDKVIWLRGVDDDIKGKVLKNAKALLNTNWNNYHEMFGVTMIESLACGVPIIGWGHKTQPSAVNFQGGEIIEHGKHGFINEYTDYSNEQKELSINKAVEFLQQINEIDRQECHNLFLSKFTSKIMADKHLKYYSIIKERGKVLNITEEL